MPSWTLTNAFSVGGGHADVVSNPYFWIYENMFIHYIQIFIGDN